MQTWLKVHSMTEEIKDITIEGHKKFGPDLYMRTWELMEKENRTPDENDEMIQCAHASLYHWTHLKGHIDDEKWRNAFAIGHSQISYAYLEVGNAERALYHAQRCLEYFEKYAAGGFPDAYGYDNLAKAYDLAGETEKRDEATRKAIEAGNKIEDENFRNSFFEELSTVGGYEEVKAGM